ncbi:MAG: YbhB/YbcL family Raf kinase inhibitor-like protein [Patescibacteria group bacterium]|jgi:Raf kinase inhibitor-like YbhB/YbcL family protein
MQITSPAFSNNGDIPQRYTCDGQDINPPLSLSDIPEEAESLVITVTDPDTPGKTWVHWVVFNISPDVKEVEEDSVPEGGILGSNDFGQTEYGGPCPPSGETHHYFFTVYAIYIKTTLEEGVVFDEVMETIEDNIIDSAELVGTYRR